LVVDGASTFGVGTTVSVVGGAPVVAVVFEQALAAKSTNAMMKSPLVLMGFSYAQGVSRS
jgi:hypothetical protein